MLHSPPPRISAYRSSFSTSSVIFAKAKRDKQAKYAKATADYDSTVALDDIELDYEPTDRTIINIMDPVHQERLAELQSIFPKKDIKYLAVKSPQVFMMPFADVVYIVRYISSRMGLDQQQMVKNRTILMLAFFQASWLSTQ